MYAKPENGRVSVRPQLSLGCDGRRELGCLGVSMSWNGYRSTIA